MLSHSLQGNSKGNFKLVINCLLILLKQQVSFEMSGEGGKFLYPEVAYLMWFVSSF